MSAEKQMTERIQGYCALCVSRCGATGMVEGGRLVSLEPDPSHPTGKRSAPRGGPHQNSSTIPTGCSTRSNAPGRKAIRIRAGSGSVGRKRWI